MDKRILIDGIGGVGGLLACQLVKAYGPAVSLIARGARRDALRANGLTMHGQIYGTYTVQPAVITEDPAALPVQDVIFVCVKNGSLPEVCAQIAPVVGESTIVVPVMNGVSAGEVLRAALGRGTVLDSVIYTVASAGADYSITQQGGYTNLFVGSRDPAAQAAVRQVAALLQGAGVNGLASENIESDIWKKYILNCAFNVVTARWGITIGAVRADAQLLADCRALMTEAAAVGAAKGVALPDELVETHMLVFTKTSDPASESSLSRDFAAGRAGELELFTGDLVRQAAALGIPVPVSAAYYKAMRAMADRF